MFGVKWSEHDTQKLIEMMEAGCTKAAAAKELQCKVTRVTAKARQLNLTFLREDEWTDRDIERLKFLVKEKKSLLEITRVLNRTGSAVVAKARKYNLSIVTADISSNRPERHRDAWTNSDDHELESKLNDGWSVEQLCDVLGRSPGAIRNHMSVLGLSLNR